MIHRSGRIIQNRVDAMSVRMVRAVRRETIHISVGLVGVSFLVTAWILANVALHDWLSVRWSNAAAHLVVAGVQLLGGGLALTLMLILTPAPPPPALQARRIHYRKRYAQALRHAESAPPVRAAKVAPRPAPETDSTQDTLSDTIELVTLAARTIPRLIKFVRR